LIILDELVNAQGCFSADSFVTLADGKQKIIAELHSGDRVLAYDDKTKKIIATDVITMLDNQPNQFGSISQFCFFIYISSFSDVQTINHHFWSTIISHLFSSSSN
jgi:hypothetical protein